MRFLQTLMLGMLICLVIGLTPQVAFAKKGCSYQEAVKIREHPNDVLEFLGTTLYSGSFEGRNHYDAVVVGWKRGGFVMCHVYETDSNVSTEATQLDEWGGRVFVTITTNGGSPELDAYAAGGWIPSYGSGGGSQVALIAEIDADDGIVEKGTYIISKTAEGLTNSVIVYGVQFYDFKVHVTGLASSYLLTTDGGIFDYVQCPRGSEFHYVLDYDMKQLLDVECLGTTQRSDAVLRNTGELPENLAEPINPGGGFFAYCNNTGGIDIYGSSGEMGYELFGVPNYTIGNGLKLAVDSGANVLLGESGIISLWALSTDELQLHTSEPYNFIFSKYRCGDPVVTGEAITVSTSSSPPPVDIVAPSQPESNPIPEHASSLPIYHPSSAALNEDGTYTVKNGDTLSIIAAKLGVDVDELATANRIINRGYIFVGQVLKMPSEDEE